MPVAFPSHPLHVSFLGGARAIVDHTAHARQVPTAAEIERVHKAFEEGKRSEGPLASERSQRRRANFQAGLRAATMAAKLAKSSTHDVEPVAVGVERT